MSALRIGIAAALALIALQALWHGVLAPPPSTPVALVLAVCLLPLVPGAWMIRSNPRRGLLLTGILSLFYFCHGVSEAWSDPQVRALALVEIVLTLAIIGALGWDARHYRRR